MKLSLSYALNSLKGLIGYSYIVSTLELIQRILQDGGTIFSIKHLRVTYNKVTEIKSPTLLCTCDSSKATVLYSLYVEKHPYYSAYVDRIVDDGGTENRLANLYTFADALNDNNLEDDALLWLSASAGKATVLYRHKAFTDVDTHETRVTTDSGTVASSGNNARVAQDLLADSLYFSASVIVPCASGKATVLYSLIPN